MSALTHDLFHELDPHTRLLMVQFGDYAEAFERFEAGGEQTYYGQRYTVDFVAELARRCERVTVLSYSTTYPLRRLSNGVHVVAQRMYPEGGIHRHAKLIRLAAREAPTHVVLGGPLLPLLAWTITRNVRAMAMFADSFTLPSPVARLKYKVLATLLNNRRFCWVSNHNLAASLDLVRIGVKPEKVVPFDWPAELSPKDFEPKTLDPNRSLRLIYVGMMIESKGIGDAIRAVALLRDRGENVSLSLVGGQSETHAELARELGISDRISFLGRQPHTRVTQLMNEHDVVLVPTRHEYPEGLPMTIYEGLCSRSPVIFSDHPMFKLRLTDGKTGVRFVAASADSLADAIMRLKSNPDLYAHLSQRADEATTNYLCPVKWDRMLAALVSPRPTTQDGVRSYSLASSEYGPRLLENL